MLSAAISVVVLCFSVEIHLHNSFTSYKMLHVFGRRRWEKLNAKIQSLDDDTIEQLSVHLMLKTFQKGHVETVILLCVSLCVCSSSFYVSCCIHSENIFRCRRPSSARTSRHTNPIFIQVFRLFFVPHFAIRLFVLFTCAHLPSAYISSSIFFLDVTKESKKSATETTKQQQK